MFILIQRYIHRIPAPNISLMSQFLKFNECNMIFENRISALELNLMFSYD